MGFVIRIAVNRASKVRFKIEEEIGNDKVTVYGLGYVYTLDGRIWTARN